jgi:hypothetical protein
MKRLALLIAFLSTLSASAATFYVSGTNGNDAWSGTLAAPNSTNTDGPFRTLTKAQSAMINSSTIKTVTIRGGMYTLTSNLSFFSSSNGQTWIPFQNETPIIDGAGLYDFKGNGTSNLTFEGLTFQHMNNNLTTSVGFGVSGDHLTLRWNTFLGCHRYCVVGVLTNSLIDSNHVNGQSPGQDNGAESPTYASMQFWDGSNNDTFSHNLYENTQGGALAVPADNFVVDRNLIRNVDTNVADWGALYISHGILSTHNIQITNNYISGDGGVNFASDATKAIYLDDLVSFATVSGNICRSCGTEALQIHGGKNNTITNNIFDLSTGVHAMALYQTSSAGFTGMTNNVFTKNIVYTSCSVPQLWIISLLSGDALPNVSHNLYYSGCGASIPNTGAVDSSPVYANPQFADAANGNYAMPSTAPAFTSIGFTALPTDQGPLPSPFVTGAQPPTISSFTASPSSISSGASSTLAWAASGATSLSINQGVGTVTGLTSTPVSPTSSTVFTLTASNSAGSVTRSLTVTVAGTALPTISSFTASPSTITAGNASSLAWSVSGATSLSVDQGLGTVTGTSTSVSPVVTTAFTLTAANSAGSVSRTVTVNVRSVSTLVSPRQAAIF